MEQKLKQIEYFLCIGWVGNEKASWERTTINILNPQQDPQNIIATLVWMPQTLPRPLNECWLKFSSYIHLIIVWALMFKLWPLSLYIFWFSLFIIILRSTLSLSVKVFALDPVDRSSNPSVVEFSFSLLQPTQLQMSTSHQAGEVPCVRLMSWPRRVTTPKLLHVIETGISSFRIPH